MQYLQEAVRYADRAPRGVLFVMQLHAHGILIKGYRAHLFVQHVVAWEALEHSRVNPLVMEMDRLLKELQ